MLHNIVWKHLCLIAALSVQQLLQLRFRVNPWWHSQPVQFLLNFRQLPLLETSLSTAKAAHLFVRALVVL